MRKAVKNTNLNNSLYDIGVLPVLYFSKQTRQKIMLPAFIHLSNLKYHDGPYERIDREVNIYYIKSARLLI